MFPFIPSIYPTGPTQQPNHVDCVYNTDTVTCKYTSFHVFLSLHIKCSWLAFGWFYFSFFFSRFVFLLIVSCRSVRALFLLLTAMHSKCTIGSSSNCKAGRSIERRLSSNSRENSGQIFYWQIGRKKKIRKIILRLYSFHSKISFLFQTASRQWNPTISPVCLITKNHLCWCVRVCVHWCADAFIIFINDYCYSFRHFHYSE